MNSYFRMELNLSSHWNELNLVKINDNLSIEFVNEMR